MRQAFLEDMTAVSSFMTKKVRTTDPSTKASAAAKVMAKANIGSLVVVSGREGKDFKGMLTERDLLAKVLAEDEYQDTITVGEVMTPTISQIEPGQSLKQAASAMTLSKGRLVVVEKERMIGIVTATDILRAIRKEGASFDISKTVTKKIRTVGTETTVREVIKLMSQKRIGSVLVSRNGRPFGIVTERDLIKKVLVPGLQLQKKVVDVATKTLITARDGLTGKEAASIMATKGIKRLPLIKGEDVVAIVTARDIVEAFATSG